MPVEFYHPGYRTVRTAYNKVKPERWTRHFALRCANTWGSSTQSCWLAWQQCTLECSSSRQQCDSCCTCPSSKERKDALELVTSLISLLRSLYGLTPHHGCAPPRLQLKQQVGCRGNECRSVAISKLSPVPNPFFSLFMKIEIYIYISTSTLSPLAWPKTMPRYVHGRTHNPMDEFDQNTQAGLEWLEELLYLQQNCDHLFKT